MQNETIVAVYDTAAHAEAAKMDLKLAGVPESAVSVHAGATSTGAGTTAPVREEGFWASLFGGDTYQDSTVYDRSMASGSTVITVTAQEVPFARVMEILEKHNPIDIDERATGYGLTQTSEKRAPLMGETREQVGITGRADAGAMQLSEENISVGKRVVNHGGTRIRRYVVETPVEEQVTLHDETVKLDRRPVTDGRPVTGSFTDKTIEMSASSEEAVVSKTAHVYEEVGLRKEVADRVETVRDTVRKEEVEIEKIPGGTTAPRSPKV